MTDRAIARPQPVWDVEPWLRYVPDKGFVHDYVQYATRCTDAPPMYHIMSALGIASVCVAPQSDLVFEGQVHPLHLFLLIVGDSSRSRKSSSIKRASRVASKVLDPISQRGPRLWWPGVSSPEGMMEELAKEPNRLMLLSEWTDLARLSQAGYWQHNTEFLNTLYDAVEEMNRVRAKATTKITRPRVSILGASTRDLVESATTLLDWLSGKMARYLICCSVRPPEIPDMDAEVDEPETLPAIWNQLGYIASGLASTVTLSADAWDVIRDWGRDQRWRDLQARAGGHLQSCFARAQEHVFRTAAIYEATATPNTFRIEVRPETAIAAINLVWYCFEALVQTFTTIYDQGDYSGLARVEAIIKAAGLGGIARTTLLRRSKLTAKRLDECLGTLKERGELKHGKTPKGAPSYLYDKPND